MMLRLKQQLFTMQSWNSIMLGNRMLGRSSQINHGLFAQAPSRSFCSVKPATLTEIKKLANERAQEDETKEEELEFVKKTQNLRQIFKR